MDLSALKQNFKGEITTDEADIHHYSRDASIFEIAPQAIVFPKDTADVQALVNFVNENKAQIPDLSLTPRGGGTDMTGGSINNSIIVDFTRHMNTISNLTNNSVVTESGVMFRDLEVKLTARNLVMPGYPMSKMWAAVGGMVGNNSGGEKTFKYGQAKEYVMELEVVLNDGNVYTVKPLTETELKAKISQNNFEGQLYKNIFDLIQDNYRAIEAAKPTTSKNASGYFLWDVWNGKTFDLTKLFVGSQGTLGIITKIKWKLIPIQRFSKLLVFFLEDLSKLGTVITHVNELRPESFEMYDKHTWSLALRYLPEIIKKMKGNGIKLMFSFLPELWLMIRGGLPDLIMLVEFAGESAQEVEAKALAAQKNIETHFNLKTHLCKDAQEAQKFWTIRRESYNLLRQHNARKLSSSFIEDVVVHPDQLPEFLPKLNAILKKYPDFITTMAGHAGDANFHIIPLVDISEEKHRQQILQISDEVFHLVKSYNGSMTAEHSDGLVRGPFLPFMFGEKIFELFKKTKTIFDPQNIFNPHKKVDADLQFYTDHIRHN